MIGRYSVFHTLAASLILSMMRITVIGLIVVGGMRQRFHNIRLCLIIRLVHYQKRFIPIVLILRPYSNVRQLQRLKGTKEKQWADAFAGKVLENRIPGRLKPVPPGESIDALALEAWLAQEIRRLDTR